MKHFIQEKCKRWLIMLIVLASSSPSWAIDVDGVSYEYNEVFSWESSRQAQFGREGGNTYYHVKNLKIEMQPGKGAAIEIAGNVIIAVEGSMSVKGGDALGFIAGGAGIHVPHGSTLRIMAWEDKPCTVTANGGHASDPNVMLDYTDNRRFDNGGGGAGAGIGGNGGRGGNATGLTKDSKGNILLSNYGQPSAACGDIIIDKNVNLTAYGGRGAGVLHDTATGIKNDWDFVLSTDTVKTVGQFYMVAGAQWDKQNNLSVNTEGSYCTGTGLYPPYSAYGCAGCLGGGGGGYPAAGIGGGGSGGGAGGLGGLPGSQTNEAYDAFGDGGHGGGGGTGYGIAGTFGLGGEGTGARWGAPVTLIHQYRTTTPMIGPGNYSTNDVWLNIRDVYNGRNGYPGQKNFSGLGHDYGETVDKQLTTVRPGSFLRGGNGAEKVSKSNAPATGNEGGGVLFDSQSGSITIRGTVVSKANGGLQKPGYDDSPGFHVSYVYENLPCYINDIGHALPGEQNPFTVLVEPGGSLTMNRKDYIKIITDLDPSGRDFEVRVKNYVNEKTYINTYNYYHTRGINHFRENVGRTALYVTTSGWNETYLSYYQTGYNESADHIHTPNISMNETYYSNVDIPTGEWGYTTSGTWGTRIKSAKFDYGFKARVDTATADDQLGVLLFDANVSYGVLNIGGETEIGETFGWTKKAAVVSGNTFTGKYTQSSSQGRADMRSMKWVPVSMIIIGSGSPNFSIESVPIDGVPKVKIYSTDGSGIIGYYSEPPTLEGGYLTTHGDEMRTLESFVRAGHDKIYFVTWNPNTDIVAPSSRDKIKAMIGNSSGSYGEGLGGVKRAMADMDSGKMILCSFNFDTQKSIFFTYKGSMTVQVGNDLPVTYSSAEWTTGSISVGSGSQLLKFTSTSNGTHLYDLSADYPLAVNEDGSYLITNAEQLMAFAEQFNNNLIPDTVTVKLGADINLSGYAWEPIGYYYRKEGETYRGSIFRGTFDGCGHSIKNMKVSGGYFFGGFFGGVENATIKNFGIESGSVEITNDSYANINGIGWHGVGGIAGKASGNTLFECVYNRANVINRENTTAMNYTGGIVGYVEGAVTFRNVYNRGNISAYGANNYMQMAAGITGMNSDDMKAYWCYNTGRPSVEIEDGARAFTAGSWVPMSYGCTSDNIFCAGYDYSWESFRDERIDPLTANKMEFAYFLNTDLKNTDLLHAEPVQNVWTFSNSDPYPILAFGGATPIYMIHTSDAIVGFAQQGSDFSYESGATPVLVNDKFSGISPKFTVTGNTLIEPYAIEISDGRYVVRNTNDLDAVSNMVNVSGGAEFHITVIGTIETSGDFRPLGSDGNTFRGSITGGHIVLTNDHPLIASAADATFTDMTVSGNLTGCESMFALSLENCSLENCRLAGALYSSLSPTAAGFAKNAKDVTFHGCMNEAVITATVVEGQTANVAGFAIGSGLALDDCGFGSSIFLSDEEGTVAGGQPFVIATSGTYTLENSFSSFDPGVDELPGAVTDNVYIRSMEEAEKVNFMTKADPQFTGGEVAYLLAKGGESHWHTPAGALYPDYDSENTYRHAHLLATDGLAITSESMALTSSLYTLEGAEFTVKHINNYDCFINLNGEKVTENGVFNGTASMGESLFTVELKPTDTPEIAINFTDESLTGFTNADYTINGEKVNAYNEIAIDPKWFGSTLDIVATAKSRGPSASFMLQIPERQSLPELTIVHASAADVADGQIAGVDSSISYLKYDDEAEVYVVCGPITGDRIENLLPGKYMLRKEATSEAFASDYQEIEVRIASKPGDVISDNGILYVILTLPEGDTPGTVMTKPGVYGAAGNANLSGDIVIPPHVSLNEETFTVTEIGAYSLDGGGVSSITLPETLTAIGESGLRGLGNISSITIPAGVTSLGFELFKGCGNLKNVIFEEGTQITSIPQSAFEETGISYFEVPETVTEIGAFAFFRCPNLQTVVLPSNLKSMGWMIFGDSENLHTIIYLSDEPVAGSDVDFPDYATPTLYALVSARDKYLAADPWCKFTNIVWCGIELSKTEADIEIGATDRLSASLTLPPTMTGTDITWESSDPTIATVNDNGEVTGITNGNALITAKSGPFSATCNVMVAMAAGIDDIFADGTATVDVYNMQGILMKRNASRDDLNTLTPGFYIIGGKKVLLRHN